jgi:OOP family OmpA-OmpF porin
MDRAVKCFLVLAFLAGFLHLTGSFDPLSAQDQEKLNEAKELLAKAQEKMADVLSPETYLQAKKAYEDAVKRMQKGEKLEKIRSLLDESIQNSNTAIRNTELAKVTFEDVLPARKKALDADAPRLAADEWKKADDKFYNAANELERGNANKAKSLGAEAEDLFRHAELVAIKEDITGETRRFIASLEEEDVDDLAPLTFSRAKQELQKAEAILDKDRYRKDDARMANSVAMYEARHAQDLARRIKQFDDKDRTLEELYLQFEDDLMTVGKAAGESLQFDQGLEKAVGSLEQRVAVLSEERDSLESELTRTSELYAGTREDREVMQEELSKVRERRQRIEKVRSLFDQGEAQVFLDGDQLIIRLTGFTFPSGTAVIEPDYFPLLTKVQRAIGEFPESQIAIEGHTDSTGDPGFNKQLSQKRADAIRTYLVANLGINPSRIIAIGYGAEKPIATNDTSEGRAKNRRVDVVIQSAM